MTPTRALIDAAEEMLKSQLRPNASHQMNSAHNLRAAIKAAKAEDGVETELLNRLINAKHLLDTKAIDDGDFIGFAEEIADEVIEVREKEGSDA